MPITLTKTTVSLIKMKYTLIYNGIAMQAGGHVPGYSVTPINAFLHCGRIECSLPHSSRSGGATCFVICAASRPTSSPRSREICWPVSCCLKLALKHKWASSVGFTNGEYSGKTGTAILSWYCSGTTIFRWGRAPSYMMINRWKVSLVVVRATS